MTCSDASVVLIVGAVILAAVAGTLLGLLHLRNSKD